MDSSARCAEKTHIACVWIAFMVFPPAPCHGWINLGSVPSSVSRISIGESKRREEKKNGHNQNANVWRNMSDGWVERANEWKSSASFLLGFLINICLKIKRKDRSQAPRLRIPIYRKRSEARGSERGRVVLGIIVDVDNNIKLKIQITDIVYVVISMAVVMHKKAWNARIFSFGRLKKEENGKNVGERSGINAGDRKKHPERTGKSEWREIKLQYKRFRKSHECAQ